MQLCLALAADSVAARLVAVALSKRTKTADAIAAARDIPDKAGVRPEREATGPNDTVHWVSSAFIEGV